MSFRGSATAFIPLLAALPAGANSSAWPVALLSAAALQGALEAVPTIGQVRVTAANDSAVAGGSGSGAVVDYSITFVAAAGDVPDLALDLSRSGAGVAVALTSCNAGRVQAVSPAAAPGVATALGGFFALSAGQAWGPGTVTTPQLAANASAADVAAAVTALPGVGGVTVTHVPGPSGVGVGLYSCLVTLAPAAGAGASPPPLFAEGRWLTGVG